MDQRTRKLKRSWSHSGDIHDHTRLLRHLIRHGLLEKRRVICAGFFGHKASRLAMPEEIKRHKVIVAAKTLKTEELNDFIFNIFYWPRDVYLRAVLAASRLSVRNLSAPAVIQDLAIINRRLQDYIENKDTYEAYVSAIRRRHSWYMSTLGFHSSNRQRVLTRSISNMLFRINRHAVICPNLQALGANFKDKIFRKAIGDEVIPYLLGEWK
jgi:hypothetical protein